MAFQKKNIPWNKDKKTGIKTKGTTGMKFGPRPKKVKDKISKAHKGKIRTKEHSQNISKAKKGSKQTKESNIKRSKTLKERYRKNPELKKKLAHCGSDHPNWKGGISFEPYSVDWTETLKRSIRERDHYICQLCSQYGNSVHHIDYNKLNCNPDNLITLCSKCNSKVNFNRDYWTQYFKKDG